jgi:hypothetical protein
MALDFLENPRRAPRVRARCRVAASVNGVAVEGQTEDVGPHGCQFVASRPLPKGTLLTLVLRPPHAGEHLQVQATVAWASPQAPWRLGVAFAEASRQAATRFFDTLVAAQPGLANWRRVPDRISFDAMVWLAPPPRLVVDFTPEEVAVLRAVGTGATVFELKSRLRDRWAVGQRALFSLLTSQFVTLTRGGAVPFANWSKLLHELENELAASSLEEPASPPSRPAPAAPRPPTRTMPAAPRAPGPPSPPARPAPGARPATGFLPEVPPPPEPALPSWAHPGPGDHDSSAGLDMDLEALELDTSRGAPGRPARPAEAEEAYQQALVELAGGRYVSAMALLRRALALSPGDAEIARRLGAVASGQR